MYIQLFSYILLLLDNLVSSVQLLVSSGVQPAATGVHRRFLHHLARQAHLARLARLVRLVRLTRPVRLVRLVLARLVRLVLLALLARLERWD